MAVKTQDAADYYIWEVPGKSVVVNLRLDVVDRLLAVVLGALPKRGAEVGGLLLGTVEHGEPARVRVEDFEPVECEYHRGPSYIFTEADRAVLEAALERWQPSDSRPACAVGFYRSHTHDGLSLTPEDLQLTDKYFQSNGNIVLLVKPSRAEASTAGFFFREAGVFQEKTPLEFPFRRSDLGGEETPPRSPAREPARSRLETRGAAERVIPPVPASAAAAPSKLPKSHGPGALWIPLSFVFLLVGLGLGLTLAPARGFGRFHAETPDFSLGLSVSRPDENIAIKWNGQAPAIRSAAQGSIEIVDGRETVSRRLDTMELQTGSLIYRNSSNAVKIRLIVYPSPRISVTETAEWPR